MAQETDNYTDYPMFKGLQRPLEFMGLQGRYITWAAITAAVGILGFLLVHAGNSNSTRYGFSGFL